MSALIIGTRGSELALWQANHIKSLLHAIGINSELKIIKTKGDNIQHLSFEKIEGKGFFTKELEDALLNKEIHLAVHSHKDLPTSIDERLVVAAVPQREDNSETIIINPLKADQTSAIPVKQNAVIGTSSSRRKAQIKLYRKDLIIKDIRGNVPTRIAKLRNGDFDAILLATAGLKRLNLDLSEFFVHKFNTEHFVPAPAQGALALQCRKDDIETILKLKKLTDQIAQEEISSERMLLSIMDGGCQLPLGVSIKNVEKKPQLSIAFSQNHEKAPVRLSIDFPVSKEKLIETANKMKAGISHSVFVSSLPQNMPVLYNSISDNFDKFLFKPLIKIEFEKSLNVPQSEWLFFNSKNAIDAFFKHNHLSFKSKIACYGESTAKHAKKYFNEVHFFGNGGFPEQIASEFFSLHRPKSVVFLGSDKSNKSIMSFLPQETQSVFLVAYKTTPITEQEYLNHDLLVFTSAMNLKTYCSTNKIQPHQKVVCFGNTVKQEAIKYEIGHCIVPNKITQIGLLETIYSSVYSLK